MSQAFRRLLLALLLAFAMAVPAAAQTFPALTGRVVDDANILPPEVESQLSTKLNALEQQSQRQLVVVTVPSLQGYEISDYGYRLGRQWGIGSKARNDGAMLIVAPNERKVRIEVGYGLEPVLTDGMSFLIINNAILPRFKAGDLPGGIVAGTDAIVQQLTLPAEEARQLAAKADKQQQDQDEGFPFGLIVWLAIFFFFFVLPMIRGVRGGRAYRGGAPVILFPGGFGGGRSGGGFGGGGFSGGGGSFGGGGASGSW
jgi:uncharacterized protein